MVLNNINNMLLKRKQAISVLKSVTMAVSITLLFTSCVYQLKDNVIKQTPKPSTVPMSTLQPKVTPTPPIPTTTPISLENASRENRLFAPIIDAYAALEQSGYTTYDKGKIGDSLLAESGGSTYNFGWDTKPTLMYGFYDINGDGSHELLIGADKLISGIYTLQNGTPVSVIQVESRHDIRLLTDSDGKCVIEDSKGHMGYATEIFYTLNAIGKLLTLNKLYTDGDIKKGDEVVGSIRTKDVNGKEIRITEDEYCSLIRKYGSDGYYPFEDIGKARTIDVAWKPVADYNKH